MTLLEILRKRKLSPDFQWQLSHFREVKDVFVAFNNRSEDVEILSLWATRFRSLTLTENQIQKLNDYSISTDLLVLINLCTDRWVDGDPSYKLILIKALQNLLQIKANLLNFEENFALFVTHAASYETSDIRITYGVLETAAKTNKDYGAKILAALPKGFIERSFARMVNCESQCGQIGRCLAAILGPLGPKIWFSYTEAFISEASTYQTVMVYFVEPVLKQSRESQLKFDEFYALCQRLQNPNVEIGILKAGKNAKIDVSEQIKSSAMIVESLSSLSRNLRYDALSLLCNSTHKLSEPVPPAVFTTIINNADSLLAEGEPKSRATVHSALRNLFSRINISKSHDSAYELINFLARWCITSLCPGSPYRCLAMAARILDIFIEFNVPVLDPNQPWHQDLLRSLLNCVVSDFNDIRGMSVKVLKNSSDLSFVNGIFDDLSQEALKLMGSSRNGEAGARLWQFLYTRKPDAGLPERILSELQARVDLAIKNFDEATKTTRIHGFISSLRLTPPADKTKAIALIREVCRICTLPLTEIAPEGASDDLINYCWRAVKESSLLLESYANLNILGDQQEDLLRQIASMLADITHWGAFTSLPPTLVAISKGYPHLLSQIVWGKVEDLKSGSHGRSVTRRSAGLPLLIASYLQIDFDEKIIDALFDLASLPFEPTVGEADDLEMSQVHGMNCIRAVVATAELSKASAKYLGRAFEQCLKMISSPSWSLRNCAAMLFSTLYKRLFGVRGIPMAGSVFFQKYRNIKTLLEENLMHATRVSELHSVFPALAILGKLKPVTTNDKSLAVFWPAIIELLGSKAWKIRELAAHAVRSIAHHDEIAPIIIQFCEFANLSDQNELHGFGLAIAELLDVLNAQNESPELQQLSSCFPKLIQLIRGNRCMETSAILYLCYAKMGGKDRIVAFNDLPKFEYLNRSLQAFEAEQVTASQKCDADVMTFESGWDLVLEALPPAQWTLELVKGVLNQSRNVLPEIRVACLESLVKAEKITWPDKISVVGPLLSAAESPSVREAAMVVLSHHITKELYPQWSTIVGAFAKDDAPPESRRSAVRALDTFLARNPHNDAELYSLLLLLTDEEEDIRDSTAKTVSKYFKLPPTASGRCAQILVENISGGYLARQITADLEEATQVAIEAYTSSEDAMFLIEKESSYEDSYRLAQLQLSRAVPTDVEKQAARSAQVLLEGVDFETPLRANASTDLMTIRLIVEKILNK